MAPLDTSNSPYVTPLVASSGALAGGHGLDEETIDDILYLARTNETAELRAVIDELANKFNIPLGDVIALAFDPYSGNGCMHMSAGNGHVGTYASSITSSRVSEGFGIRVSPAVYVSLNGFYQDHHLNHKWRDLYLMCISVILTVSPPIACSGIDSFRGFCCILSPKTNPISSLETLQILIPLLTTSTLPQILPAAATAPSSPHLLHWPNHSGSTPLHYAAVNGQLEAVKLLLAAGADPKTTNAAGHNAIFQAEQAGRDGVVGYLLSLGQGGDEEKVEGAEAAEEEAQGKEDKSGEEEVNGEKGGGDVEMK
jgi:uncharacterized protein